MHSIHFYLLSRSGIVNSEGTLWKSQRRFLLNQQLGLKSSSHHGGLRSTSGLRQMESRIQAEMVDLLRTLAHDYDDRPVDPEPLVKCAVSNVVSSIIMSTRFRHDDAKFLRFMHLFDEGFRLFTETGWSTLIPVLRHLPGVRSVCTKLRANRDEMVAFVREVVSDHAATLDPEKPRDLVDSYLVREAQLRNDEDARKQFYDGYDADRQLEQIVLDLFSAGVETVSNSLLWALVYMLHNPSVMERVKEELNSVVGESRLPELDDMKDLPYTRATLFEVLRKSSIVPLGASHATNG